MISFGRINRINILHAPLGRHHIDGETLGLKGGHVFIRGNRIHMLGLSVLVLHVVDFHILHIGQGGILNFHGNRFVRLPFIPLAVIDSDVIGSQDRQVLQRNLHRLSGHIGTIGHQTGHGNLRIVIRHRSNGIIFPNWLFHRLCTCGGISLFGNRLAVGLRRAIRIGLAVGLRRVVNNGFVPLQRDLNLHHLGVLCVFPLCCKCTHLQQAHDHDHCQQQRQSSSSESCHCFVLLSHVRSKRLAAGLA